MNVEGHGRNVIFDYLLFDAAPCIRGSIRDDSECVFGCVLTTCVECIIVFCFGGFGALLSG